MQFQSLFGHERICTNPLQPKMQRLNTTICFYYISGFLWVRNSGAFWLGDLWGGCSEGASQSCSHLRAGPGQEDLLPGGGQFGASCWWDTFCLPHTRVLFDCPQGDPERDNPKQDKAEPRIPFMTWPQKSHLHFCCILLVKGKSLGPASLQGEE